MRVLSFDVGIKNLAWCEIDISENYRHIHELKCESIISSNDTKSTNNVSELADALLSFLLENFSDPDVDIVLIENQPVMKNATMKTLSVVIYTYFKMARMMYGRIQDVKFISASNKLKCVKCKNIIDSQNNLNYKDRKRISIEATSLYLQELFPTSFEEFKCSKKKDDLSDAFLAAWFFVYSGKQ